MHETIWPQGQELLAVEWQQFADNAFTEPTITKTKQEGIKSSQPEASKKAYTPPHLRLKKEGKNPEKLIQPLCTIPGLPPGNQRKFWQKQYDLKYPPLRSGSSGNAVNNHDTRNSHQNYSKNRYLPYHSQKRH